MIVILFDFGVLELSFVYKMIDYYMMMVLFD